MFFPWINTYCSIIWYFCFSIHSPRFTLTSDETIYSIICICHLFVKQFALQFSLYYTKLQNNITVTIFGKHPIIGLSHWDSIWFFLGTVNNRTYIKKSCISRKPLPLYSCMYWWQFNVTSLHETSEQMGILVSDLELGPEDHFHQDLKFQCLLKCVDWVAI